VKRGRFIREERDVWIGVAMEGEGSERLEEQDEIIVEG
jgi:hypothetical protein